MADLQRLIEQFGKPDALIDHWDSTSNRFAVWGFTEQFLLNSSGKAIINGELSIELPLVSLQKTLDRWKINRNEIAAVGFISYDLKNFLFPHIPFKEPQLSEPLLWFGKPKRVIPYENMETHQNSFSPFLQLERDIPPPQEYQEAIRKIKTSLKNGDSYQINFTQPKKYKLNREPLEMYLTMRETVHPHYGMYLNPSKIQILSFSPERFFKTSGGVIESFPMKGTRPRSCDMVRDEILAGELFHSEKDRAEHLMIWILSVMILEKFANTDQ